MSEEADKKFVKMLDNLLKAYADMCYEDEYGIDPKTIRKARKKYHTMRKNFLRFSDIPAEPPGRPLQIP